ncbi:hypothetical protein C0Q70_11014 [Pomacea canaliculata]|uniref:Uncharacterized protein n=1 Tax=Pomacea canaliculata TaxID=400727 RepID=A0A2T7P4S7_POMCA|nr:hypothetical protein C0Q70_11014 [Pomacea canaliculata]
MVACPATPVLDNSLSMRPDAGCMFPGMRFEDLRLASFFNARNHPISQFLIPLAHDGYYYDVIYEYTCCFCCGNSYSRGHSPTCGGRRAQSSVPFARCALYRQQQMARDLDLQTIISSLGIKIRYCAQHATTVRPMKWFIPAITAQGHARPVLLSETFAPSVNEEPLTTKWEPDVVASLLVVSQA